MSRISNIINTIFIAVNCLVIVILSIHIRLIYYSDDDFVFLSALVHNWNNTMIRKLYITDANQVCPIGYYNILSGNKWPKRDLSCKCGANIAKGECVGTNEECTTINQTTLVEIKHWKNSTICYQPFKLKLKSNTTSDYYNYFDITSTTENIDCTSENYCSRLHFNSEFLCPIEKDICPLIYLSATTGSYKIRSKYIDVFFYTINSKSLFITSVFTISSSIPCSDPRYKILSGDPALLDKYILANNTSCPGQNLTANYKKVDSYNITSFLSENSILPSTNYKDEEKIDLIQQGYIGVNYYTRNLVREKYGSSDFLQLLKTERFSIKVALVMIIVTTLSTVSLVLQLFRSKHSCLNSERKIKAIISALFLFLQMIIAIILYIKFDYAYLLLVGEFCEESMNSNLEKNTNLATVSKHPLYVLFANVILGFTYFFRLVYILCFSTKKINKALKKPLRLN